MIPALPELSSVSGVPEYPMLDGPTLTEARDLLRRILRAVAAGELSTDGPAAAQLVRRLEGSELTLSELTASGLVVGSVPVRPKIGET